jgi:hypothetical protein
MKRKIKITKSPSFSEATNQGKLVSSPKRSSSIEENTRKTFKESPRENANIEAENGETIYVPDMFGYPAHFDISGDPHHKGGTPIDAPENSFIFSKTKSMSIPKEMTKEFGETKAKPPAQIAKKYDINKYRDILDDPKSDDIQKQTATMMIDNYKNKLAKLALVQESMKGFENGIPKIAEDYLSGVAGEQLPTLKKGGSINIPMIFQEGGEEVPSFTKKPTPVVPKQKTGEAPKNTINRPMGRSTGTTTGGLDMYEPMGQDKLPYKPKGDTGYTIWDEDYPAWKKMVEDALTPENIPAITKQVLKFGTFKGTDYTPRINARLAKAGNDPNKIREVLLAEATDGEVGPFHEAMLWAINSLKPKADLKPFVQEAEKKVGDIPDADLDISGAARTGAGYTPFWLQDELNTYGALYNRASLKKYMPWAAKVSPDFVEPTFYDPTRELASISEQLNTSTEAMSAFAGPQASSSRLSSLAGTGAKNAADVLARYSNQNVSTANDSERINTEINNSTLMYNAKIAQDLYDKGVLTNQQFDNSKRKADNEILKQVTNSFTNRARAQVLNELYDNFQIHPEMGGYLSFDKERQLIADKNYEATQYSNLIDQIRKSIPASGSISPEKLLDALVALQSNNKRQAPSQDYFDALKASGLL